ncbi:hypothetical protein D3C77_458000 [compost metagenome]
MIAHRKVWVWPEGFNKGDIAGRAINVTEHQVHQVAVAVFGLGLHVGIGVLVMDLPRLAATACPRRVARELARGDLVHAASGHSLVGFGKELFQLRVIHRRAIFLDVLAAIRPGDVIRNPRILVAGHLELAVTARH